MTKSRNIVSLTPNEAAEIRARAAEGEKQIDLANQYRVDKSTISKIVKGTFTPNLPRLTPEIVEAVRRWKKIGMTSGPTEDEYVAFTGSALRTCEMLYAFLRQNDAI